ncbi:MAG: hypothetical protein JXQ87_16035 [Bacteroidia bacterium]
MTSCTWDCDDPNDPECFNYDPCLDVHPAKAVISFYEPLSYGDLLGYLNKTDTVLHGSGAVFKAEGVGTKHTWVLGAETLAVDEFYRSGLPWGNIKVTLIAEVEEDSCLETHELIDTAVKYLHVWPNSGDSNVKKSHPFWGTWKGHNLDEPEKEFTISWGYIYKTPRTSFDFTGLPYGLPKQLPFYGRSSAAGDINYRLGYNSAVMYGRGLNQWAGFGLRAVCIRKGNTIRIQYSYDGMRHQRWLNGEGSTSEPEAWVSNTFIGRKISDEVLTE